MTFGTELASALTGLRPSAMARAAGLLHHVLLDNAASKQAVLEATASEGQGWIPPCALLPPARQYACQRPAR